MPVQVLQAGGAAVAPVQDPRALAVQVLHVVVDADSLFEAIGQLIGQPQLEQHRHVPGVMAVQPDQALDGALRVAALVSGDGLLEDSVGVLVGEDVGEGWRERFVMWCPGDTGFVLCQAGQQGEQGHVRSESHIPVEVPE